MRIPANTDVGWFHDFCWAAKMIILLRGRLKFGEAANSAPFATMLVLFTPTGPGIDGPKFAARVDDLRWATLHDSRDATRLSAAIRRDDAIGYGADRPLIATEHQSAAGPASAGRTVPGG